MRFCLTYGIIYVSYFLKGDLIKQEYKDLIKELTALLAENDLNEIEYGENGIHLRVVRHTPATNVAPVSTPVAEPKKEQEAKNLLISPMVGVAYLSPSGTTDTNSCTAFYVYYGDVDDILDRNLDSSALCE